MLGRIWKKQYVLRMYKRHNIVNGYSVKDDFVDKIVDIDVQPGNSTEQNFAEGDRETKSLRCYSNFPIQTADAIQFYRADRLYYDGDWFECTYCDYYEHTPIRHWNSAFTRLPESENEPAPTVSIREE